MDANFFLHYVIVAHHERGYETKFGTSSPSGSIFNHFLKITEIGRKNDRVPLFTAVHLVIENVQLVIENVHLVTQNTVLYAVSGVTDIHVR